MRFDEEEEDDWDEEEFDWDEEEEEDYEDY